MFNQFIKGAKKEENNELKQHQERVRILAEHIDEVFKQYGSTNAEALDALQTVQNRITRSHLMTKYG